MQHGTCYERQIFLLVVLWFITATIVLLLLLGARLGVVQMRVIVDVSILYNWHLASQIRASKTP